MSHNMGFKQGCKETITVLAICVNALLDCIGLTTNRKIAKPYEYPVFDE